MTIKNKIFLQFLLIIFVLFTIPSNANAEKNFKLKDGLNVELGIGANTYFTAALAYLESRIGYNFNDNFDLFVSYSNNANPTAISKWPFSTPDVCQVFTAGGKYILIRNTS